MIIAVKKKQLNEITSTHNTLYLAPVFYIYRFSVKFSIPFA